MGPTEIGRPQGPQSIPRAVLAVVHALFPEASGRCGCSTQSGAPATQEGLSGFEDFQSFPGNYTVGVPPSLKQGIGVGDWGVFWTLNYRLPGIPWAQRPRGSGWSRAPRILGFQQHTFAMSFLVNSIHSFDSALYDALLLVPSSAKFRADENSPPRSY